jgi:hypothetical protein
MEQKTMAAATTKEWDGAGENRCRKEQEGKMTFIVGVTLDTFNK